MATKKSIHPKIGSQMRRKNTGIENRYLIYDFNPKIIDEETFNKVNTHKGIEGIILSDAEGVPIKSTFNEEEKTYFYTTSASMFVKKCRNVVKELIEEDLTFIRIRTKLNEIMIAPENDFIFIVVQNPAANN